MNTGNKFEWPFLSLSDPERCEDHNFPPFFEQRYCLILLLDRAVRKRKHIPNTRVELKAQLISHHQHPSRANKRPVYALINERIIPHGHLRRVGDVRSDRKTPSCILYYYDYVPGPVVFEIKYDAEGDLGRYACHASAESLVRKKHIAYT